RVFVARKTNFGIWEPTWFFFVRPVGAVTPRRFPGTEGAAQPFWSADSRSIAFVAAGRVKRVDSTGGPPQEICEAAGFYGGTWNSDGTILFGSTQGLQRVPAEGGKPEVLTRLAEAEAWHYLPQVLPDGPPS